MRQLLLDPAALDRRRQQTGDRLQEIQLAFIETS
jgi:hypothetical protein